MCSFVNSQQQRLQLIIIAADSYLLIKECVVEFEDRI
jgi:hypothetical protein